MRTVFITYILLSIIIVPISKATFFDVYTGDELPIYPPTQDDWQDLWNCSSQKNYATLEIDNGRNVLHINDPSTDGGSHYFVHRPWTITPSNWYNSGTFVVRNVLCSEYPGSLGTYIGIQSLHSNGKAFHAFYALYKNRIHPFGNEAPDYLFDTTNSYNTYTISLHEGIINFYINGNLAFSHNAIPSLYVFSRNGVEFGAGSSAAIGNAYWDYVAARQAPDPIPEPSSIFLLITGIIGTSGIIWKYKRRN